MARGWARIRLVVLAVAALLAFAVAVPRGGWVFDDHVLIERNADLARADVWWAAFGRDYYASSEAPGVSGYYRPLAVLCNAFDVHVWRGRPQGAHLTNLVLHTLATLAVLPALAALGVSPAAAWWTALVFAVHPVHAESVAFVSGRVDVLATLFVLLALGAAGARHRWAWLGVGAASLLAFLSKESAIVLPVLLALVWWVQRRAPWKEIAALAAALALALVLRAAVLPSLLPTTAQGAAAAGNLLLPLQSLVFVLMALFAPVARLLVEPEPAQLGVAWAAAAVVVAGALWGGALALRPRARPALRCAALAGFAALLPVLNLLPQETRLSERFLYLPSAFWLAPVGVLVETAWERRGWWRRLVLAVATLVLVGLLVISSWRARLWRDDLAIWRQAVREEPERAAFWDRLGLALTERRSFGPAEEAQRRAVQLDPRNFNAWHNLGVLLQAKRDTQGAMEAYRRALALQPQSVATHVYLGRLLMAGRDLEGAYAEFQAALQVMPENFEALRMAGMVALRLEDFAAAARYLEAARRLQPDNPAIQKALERLQQRQQP